jgi:hypothetical protein
MARLAEEHLKPRPMPQPKPAAKSRPQPRTARGGSFTRQHQQAFRQATTQHRAVVQAHNVYGQRLEKPDAQTYALISQIYDPGSDRASMAKQAITLMSRPGLAGANATIHLLHTGIPQSDIAPEFLRNAQNVLRDAQQHGANLDKVPRVNMLDQSERDRLHQLLKQKGLDDPGKNATDTELLIAMGKHKPRLIDAALNAPSSAARNLIGVPVGGFQTGRALGHAVQGDPTEVKLLGHGLAAYYKHIKADPVRALEEDPIGTISALLPAKTLLGGSAGMAARAGLLGKAAKGFATAPRAATVLKGVHTVEGAAPQIIRASEQNPLSSNLIDRAAQRGLSSVTSRSGSVSRYRLKKQTIREAATSKADTYLVRDAMLRGLQEARRGMTKEERRAILAYAQGETPSRLAGFYRQMMQDEPASKWNKQRAAQAKIWDKVAKKTGDSPTPRVDAYLEAMKVPLTARERIMSQIGKVPEEQIAARRGIVTKAVSDKLGAPSPVAGLAQYVPHIDTAPQFGNFLVRKGLNPERKLAKSAKKNDLVLFHRGTWQPDLTHLEGSIAQASNVEQMYNHIRSTLGQYGRVPKPGEPYEGQLVRLAGDRKIVKPDQSGPALAQTLKELHSKNEGVSEADLITQLEQNIFAKPGTSHVPNDGASYLVIPDTVANQLRGEFNGARRGAVARAASTGTDAWRYATLFARPAWLAANAVSNPAQAILGMSDSPSGVARIPLAYARTVSGRRIPGSGRRVLGTDAHLPNMRMPGRDYSGVIPAGLKDAGWFNDLTRIQRLGANANNPAVRFASRVADSVEGRAVRRVVSAGPRAIVKANQKWEDVQREAMYLHQAMPDAKRAAAGTPFARVTDDVMKHLEAGDNTKAAQVVRDFLSDSRNKNRPNVRLAAPFYKWLVFATKLSLVTLPLKHPVRNEILQALGRSGMQEIAQLGGIPQYLKGAVPFDPEQRQVADGSTHQFAKMLATRNVNTLGTPGEFLSLNDQGNPTLSGMVSYLNPLLGAAASVAFGKDLSSGFPLNDANGNPIDIQTSSIPKVLRTLINQEARTIPGVNLLSDPTGLPADALPFTGTAKDTSTGLKQPKRSQLAKFATYLTGVNIREEDLTLANAQWLFHFADPKYNKQLPPDLAKEIRKKANKVRGMSGPFHAQQLRDAKIKKGGGDPSSTTYTPGGSAYTPGTSYSPGGSVYQP